eukprot:comp22005_c0_seq1/m.50524 comp22005_c0_seq1/g.50524  ORF comp22005_c0_seq1/g.50524 comp22005_c0_seq1/m.50524 type:complete len:560 (-) comp22005_c0_seq1:662-2341(-)
MQRPADSVLGDRVSVLHATCAGRHWDHDAECGRPSAQGILAEHLQHLCHLPAQVQCAQGRGNRLDHKPHAPGRARRPHSLGDQGHGAAAGACGDCNDRHPADRAALGLEQRGDQGAAPEAQCNDAKSARCAPRIRSGNAQRRLLCGLFAARRRHPVHAAAAARACQARKLAAGIHRVRVWQGAPQQGWADHKLRRNPRGRGHRLRTGDCQDRRQNRRVPGSRHQDLCCALACGQRRRDSHLDAHNGPARCRCPDPVPRDAAGQPSPRGAPAQDGDLLDCAHGPRIQDVPAAQHSDHTAAACWARWRRGCSEHRGRHRIDTACRGRQLALGQPPLVAAQWLARSVFEPRTFAVRSAPGPPRCHGCDSVRVGRHDQHGAGCCCRRRGRVCAAEPLAIGLGRRRPSWRRRIGGAARRSGPALAAEPRHDGHDAQAQICAHGPGDRRWRERRDQPEQCRAAADHQGHSRRGRSLCADARVHEQVDPDGDDVWRHGHRWRDAQSANALAQGRLGDPALQVGPAPRKLSQLVHEIIARRRRWRRRRWRGRAQQPECCWRRRRRHV